MGKKLTDYVGGEFINIEDVNKNSNWVVINIEEYEFDNKTKLKMNLESNGVKKDMTLNKINTEMLVELFDDDTDKIIGKVIVLKTSKTEMKGKLVDAIRINMDDTRKLIKD